MFYGGKDQSFMLWPVRGEGLSVISRTGQCLCFDAVGKVISCSGSAQDGELRYGVAWPEPRFEIFPADVQDIYWSSTANHPVQQTRTSRQPMEPGCAVAHGRQMSLRL